MESPDESFSAEQVESKFKELSKRIVFTGLMEELDEVNKNNSDLSERNHVDFLLEAADCFKNKDLDKLEQLIKRELILQFYVVKYGARATFQFMTKRLGQHKKKNFKKSKTRTIPAFENGLPRLELSPSDSAPRTSKSPVSSQEVIVIGSSDDESDEDQRQISLVYTNVKPSVREGAKASEKALPVNSDEVDGNQVEEEEEKQIQINWDEIEGQEDFFEII